MFLRLPRGQFPGREYTRENGAGDAFGLLQPRLQPVLPVKIVVAGVVLDLGLLDERAVRKMVGADELVRDAVSEEPQVEPRYEMLILVLGHVLTSRCRALRWRRRRCHFRREYRRRELNPHAPQGTRV